MMSGSELNERAQLLLKNLVERYIRDGQPVGSRTLSRETGLELSAASIRNVMADLEEMGLIHAPHTSAGRIPTIRGYRLFVDSLLTIQPLNKTQVQVMQQRIGSSADPEHLLATASRQLSEVTSMAGVVMVPRRKLAALRQLEFLPLSHNRVLVILVVNEQEVQNRIIQTRRNYSAAELQQIANYLNSVCVGRDLNQARQALLGEMDDTRSNMNQLMADAVQMAKHIFTTDEPAGDYLLDGQTNLMSYDEMANLDRLRKLFEAFNQKRDILQLLDQALHADGVQLFIGDESGYEVLDECSVVTSPYKVDGEVMGVLGVIGPTRMAYDRVIPIVDVTAQLLGASLNQMK
ncbi:MAG: heat-inducible transcriptional repressor HrcA [Gammaproteobacteria bacterium]|nr:heat-inducible transcriptional repressor HrcA [Gammaproteobacteria bacterium]MCW8841471.1 heat-inducible transcriptional repressor HrcA [Gammaproteobacteria bacterium]MCW8927584.1 heat-inducible transcriptional repressor HrcA [Gammaproteobacteria bacterium]MCW8958695.1 heat-inducible transcriptional repressor HrcA [Gammaproteobacteria bacterium]MCW8974020.1 heat-inducible transcriptional repressor HrcA [Gammaproteobacteria bacterium]